MNCDLIEESITSENESVTDSIDSSQVATTPSFDLRQDS